MPNAFGSSLGISSVFLWNMSPAGAAPNGSCLYLYLQNWHENMVRYDDCSSNLRLWYLELSFIRDKYFALVTFGNILLRVDPLWTGHINASFNLAGSRHYLTYLFGFGTSMKPLYHSAVSSIPMGVIMSCCCSHTNSSLNCFWRA